LLEPLGTDLLSDEALKRVVAEGIFPCATEDDVAVRRFEHDRVTLALGSPRDALSYDQFDHFLQAGDDVGLIVVDCRFRGDDRRLRRFFSDLTEEGTPYMKLDRIIEGLFFGPSHYSIGLQCADLVVASTLAAERRVGQGSGYFKKLRPRFGLHPATGELSGVGLKRFPDPEPRERSDTHLF
jgi:Protein of unknown function (DUF3800)